MIYFYINISSNEVSLLQQKLAKGTYCLFQLQGGTSRFYGMVKKGTKNEFLALLTPETLQHIEYLEKPIFKLFLLQNISDSICCIGNRGLLLHLSDEN
jgi:hypothetical protein